MMPEIDIQESLTRKIGPLPAWGWGLVVVGTFFVVRLFRGGGPPAASVAPTIIGGEGVSTDIPSDPIFSGSSSLITQIQTTVGGLTSWQTLQTKLTTLLNKQNETQQARSEWLQHYSYWIAVRNSATTAEQKATAQAKVDHINDMLGRYQKLLDSQKTQIIDVQKQITALGTGSTV